MATNDRLKRQVGLSLLETVKRHARRTRFKTILMPFALVMLTALLCPVTAQGEPNMNGYLDTIKLALSHRGVIKFQKEVDAQSLRIWRGRLSEEVVDVSPYRGSVGNGSHDAIMSRCLLPTGDGFEIEVSVTAILPQIVAQPLKRPGPKDRPYLASVVFSDRDGDGKLVATHHWFSFARPEGDFLVLRVSYGTELGSDFAWDIADQIYPLTQSD